MSVTKLNHRSSCETNEIIETGNGSASQLDQIEFDTTSSIHTNDTRNSTGCLKKPSRKSHRKLVQFITSKIFVGCVVFAAIFITIICVTLLVSYEFENEVTQSVDFWNENLPPEQKEWFDKGIKELKDALNVRINTKRAKNVILFVGDGMGPNTITATRIYKYQEEGVLSWEKFPHIGLLKTYCANKQVPDSFSTATALFGGVKVNYETGGVDSTVPLGNCNASLNQDHHVQSILKWAQIDGMNTGFVTTTRVTHATPAALYSHVPDRRWECENKMPKNSKDQGCKDIARILVEDDTGKNIKVIMGGGRQCLISNATGSPSDPIDSWACKSMDGRNLIDDWKKDKESRHVKYAVLNNNADLQAVHPSTDFVLGIFANGHLKYDHERDTGPNGMPSLTDMTVKALDILKKKNHGFLLVVEGGNIDQAHHRGAARKALSETAALDDAVEATIKNMKDNLDDTLIIVTADHSHTLSINGYPDRGNNILGIASNSKADSIPYTTLTYGTSNGGFQVEVDKDTLNVKRRDPTHSDTTSYDYVQQATVLTDENTHGGSDVPIYAMGPMAHLFHRVHEQSYVAHVISYVLRIGRFSDSAILESLVDILGL